VAYLGDVEEEFRAGVRLAAEGGRPDGQGALFETRAPQWVEVDASSVRVERCRAFGGPWLGLHVMKLLGLPEKLSALLPVGREEIPWAVMAEILVLCRWCDPSSELSIAERFYERSALEDLLGVPGEKVNDDRLYRAMDQLVRQKTAIEEHLRERLGELFGLSYELLLYDVTSTYFEGECSENAQAKRGYSRDHRPDCKQVCIGLVVSRCGMPLGYEVFEGNRSDVTTVKEMVTQIESRYGRADRIWVMDRGMISEETLGFLKSGDRRYIVGTPRSQLRSFERELVSGTWEQVREGLEVQRCASPDGEEVFILCRSQARREKERAIHARFEARIEEGLRKLAASCEKRRHKTTTIARQIEGLLSRNSRARRHFAVEFEEAPCDGEGRSPARAVLRWHRNEEQRQWAELSEGCYLLRSNIVDWTPQELWTAYIHLTEAENAFRIQKGDLRIRPIWHQKAERVQAHILVCFLAYVLWKTLGKLCEGAGLGQEPRQVLDELAQLNVVDVVLPTRGGVELRKRCVTQPTKHQAVLLHRLRLELPRQLDSQGM
jgi:transposase